MALHKHYFRWFHQSITSIIISSNCNGRGSIGKTVRTIIKSSSEGVRLSISWSAGDETPRKGIAVSLNIKQLYEHLLSKGFQNHHRTTSWLQRARFYKRNSEDNNQQQYRRGLAIKYSVCRGRDVTQRDCGFIEYKVALRTSPFKGLSESPSYIIVAAKGEIV